MDKLSSNSHAADAEWKKEWAADAALQREFTLEQYVGFKTAQARGHGRVIGGKTVRALSGPSETSARDG